MLSFPMTIKNPNFGIFFQGEGVAVKIPKKQFCQNMFYSISNLYASATTCKKIRKNQCIHYHFGPFLSKNASARFSFESIINFYAFATSSIGIFVDSSQNLKPHLVPIMGLSWPKNFGTKFFPKIHFVQI